MNCAKITKKKPILLIETGDHDIFYLSSIVCKPIGKTMVMDLAAVFNRNNNKNRPNR